MAVASKFERPRGPAGDLGAEGFHADHPFPTRLKIFGYDQGDRLVGALKLNAKHVALVERNREPASRNRKGFGVGTPDFDRFRAGAPGILTFGTSAQGLENDPHPVHNSIDNKDLFFAFSGHALRLSVRV
jgi:hypothetical protein